MEFKYIMFDKIRYILFCMSIEHVQMRDALRKEIGECRVTGAGFAQIIMRSDGECQVKCYGRSESLDIGPGDRDAKIIHNIAANNIGYGGSL
jgi:hypothetical protein